MSGVGISISKDRIKKIEVVFGKGKLARDIQKSTGADYVINCGFYDSRNRPTHHLKVNGVVHAKANWGCWGYTWNSGEDIALNALPDNAAVNYVGAYELITPMVSENSKLSYGTELGGRRGRTAIGVSKNKFIMYCVGDNDKTGKCTPEELRQKMLSLGATSALMLDGGGSSQLASRDKTIYSSRRVNNYLCVWLSDRNVNKGDETFMHTVCIDPGHGPSSPNGSPDGTYKEHEFAWDMYNRIAPLLVAHGINVIVTRSKSTLPSLTSRAQTSNNAKADCFVSLHSNATGNGSWSSPRGFMIYTSSGPMSAQRNVLATQILDEAKAAGIITRSSPILHEKYTVLMNTSAPACLIEFGFHTNREDVALLKTSAYRDKLAKVTAKGICKWLGVKWKDTESSSKPTIEWGKESWEWATTNGLMDGTRPNDAVSRKELAVVAQRLYNLIK